MKWCKVKLMRNGLTERISINIYRNCFQGNSYRHTLHSCFPVDVPSQPCFATVPYESRSVWLMFYSHWVAHCYFIFLKRSTEWININYLKYIFGCISEPVVVARVNTRPFPVKLHVIIIAAHSFVWFQRKQSKNWSIRKHNRKTSKITASSCLLEHTLTFSHPKTEPM